MKRPVADPKLAVAPKQSRRSKVQPAGPDVCPFCNRKTRPGSWVVDGQAVHAKCQREQMES